MNKEEIEDIKADLRILHQVLWDEHREGTYTIQKILEYINCLEQKESILDKVTDKLKEDIETYKDSKELTQKEQIELEYARKISNIIEGEKK